MCPKGPKQSPTAEKVKHLDLSLHGGLSLSESSYSPPILVTRVFCLVHSAPTVIRTRKFTVDTPVPISQTLLVQD